MVLSTPDLGAVNVVNAAPGARAINTGVRSGGSAAARHRPSVITGLGTEPRVTLERRGGERNEPDRNREFNPKTTEDFRAHLQGKADRFQDLTRRGPDGRKLLEALQTSPAFEHDRALLELTCEIKTDAQGHISEIIPDPDRIQGLLDSPRGRALIGESMLYDASIMYAAYGVRVEDRPGATRSALIEPQGAAVNLDNEQAQTSGRRGPIRRAWHSTRDWLGGRFGRTAGRGGVNRGGALALTGVGIAGGAKIGAAIGTLAHPGVGTVVGGIIGAAAPVVGEMFARANAAGYRLDAVHCSDMMQSLLDTPGGPELVRALTGVDSTQMEWDGTRFRMREGVTNIGVKPADVAGRELMGSLNSYHRYLTEELGVPSENADHMTMGFILDGRSDRQPMQSQTTMQLRVLERYAPDTEGRQYLQDPNGRTEDWVDPRTGRIFRVVLPGQPAGNPPMVARGVEAVRNGIVRFQRVTEANRVAINRERMRWLPDINADRAARGLPALTPLQATLGRQNIGQLVENFAWTVNAGLDAAGDRYNPDFTEDLAGNARRHFDAWRSVILEESQAIYQSEQEAPTIRMASELRAMRETRVMTDGPRTEARRTELQGEIARAEARATSTQAILDSMRPYEGRLTDLDDARRELEGIVGRIELTEDRTRLGGPAGVVRPTSNTDTQGALNLISRAINGQPIPAGRTVADIVPDIFTAAGIRMESPGDRQQRLSADEATEGLRWDAANPRGTAEARTAHLNSLFAGRRAEITRDIQRLEGLRDSLTGTAEDNLGVVTRVGRLERQLADTNTETTAVITRERTMATDYTTITAWGGRLNQANLGDPGITDQDLLEEINRRGGWPATENDSPTNRTRLSMARALAFGRREAIANGRDVFDPAIDTAIERCRTAGRVTENMLRILAPADIAGRLPPRDLAALGGLRGITQLTEDARSRHTYRIRGLDERLTDAQRARDTAQRQLENVGNGNAGALDEILAAVEDQGGINGRVLSIPSVEVLARFGDTTPATTAAGYSNEEQTAGVQIGITRLNETLFNYARSGRFPNRGAGFQEITRIIPAEVWATELNDYFGLGIQPGGGGALAVNDVLNALQVAIDPAGAARAGVALPRGANRGLRINREAMASFMSGRMVAVANEHAASV